MLYAKDTGRVAGKTKGSKVNPMSKAESTILSKASIVPKDHF